MNSDDVAAIAVEMADAWNAGDLDHFLEFLTDDVEWNDPAMNAPAKGRAAVEQFARSVLRAFPDFEYAIRHPICVAADCGRCAVPWRITGTHRDYLDPPGYAPTNRRAVFQGVDLLEFRGLQVYKIETLFDVVPPAEQLLSMTLRPPVGGVREWLAVMVQRVRAFWLRTVRKDVAGERNGNKPAG